MKLSKWRPVSGIYKITNVKNGKIYIGESLNILARWTKHVDDLMRGTHDNGGLLADFQEYGFSAFEVEIVEKCKNDKACLRDREEFYITQYQQQGLVLYNRNIPNFHRLITWRNKHDQ